MGCCRLSAEQDVSNNIIARSRRLLEREKKNGLAAPGPGQLQASKRVWEGSDPGDACDTPNRMEASTPTPFHPHFLLVMLPTPIIGSLAANITSCKNGIRFSAFGAFHRQLQRNTQDSKTKPKTGISKRVLVVGVVFGLNSLL